MPRDMVTELMQLSDKLFTSEERHQNENTWSDLTEFMLNNQHTGTMGQYAFSADLGSINSTSKGAKRNSRVFDSTALQAVQDLAAAFQGTLTNPATVWSKLRYQTDDLNNNEEAVLWLERVNKAIHKELSESNFDTEIAKSYQSFAALANMVLLQEAREDKNTGQVIGYRFTSVHLGQLAWGEDEDGLVDTVFRKLTMTAKQAVSRWGKEVPDDIMRVLEKDPEKEFEFLHAVFPRAKEEVELNELGLASGDKRPVASVYIAVSKKKIVENSGYYEMPYLVARWGLMPGERYGRGPGHLALPDVRTLNQLKKRSLEAIDLQVSPPILANARDIIGTLNMTPRSISVVRDVTGIKEFVSQARSDIMQFSANELKESIQKSFFIDKLQPLATLDKKERLSQLEVTKRLEEMQAVLGPVMSRLNTELLQPLIVRCFRILLRAGLLPPVPSILQERGIDIDIVFVNQLARAQQIQEVSSIQQWVQNMGMLAQIKPEVLDYIDADGIATHTAKVLGVPEIAVANEDQVLAVREQRARQQQQQQAIEQGNMIADGVSKLGGIGE